MTSKATFSYYNKQNTIAQLPPRNLAYSFFILRLYMIACYVTPWPSSLSQTRFFAYGTHTRNIMLQFVLSHNVRHSQEQERILAKTGKLNNLFICFPQPVQMQKTTKSQTLYCTSRVVRNLFWECTYEAWRAEIRDRDRMTKAGKCFWLTASSLSTKESGGWAPIANAFWTR